MCGIHRHNLCTPSLTSRCVSYKPSSPCLAVFIQLYDKWCNVLVWIIFDNGNFELWLFKDWIVSHCINGCGFTSQEFFSFIPPVIIKQIDIVLIAANFTASCNLNFSLPSHSYNPSLNNAKRSANGDLTCKISPPRHI